jgi:hypothetical protein
LLNLGTHGDMSASLKWVSGAIKPLCEESCCIQRMCYANSPLAQDAVSAAAQKILESEDVVAKRTK